MIDVSGDLARPGWSRWADYDKTTKDYLAPTTTVLAEFMFSNRS